MKSPLIKRTLAAGLHVDRIVRRSLLLLARGEHRDNTQTDRSHRQGGRPVLGEDAQADVAVAVDVWMNRNSVVVIQEGDLGREGRG